MNSKDIPIKELCTKVSVGGTPKSVCPEYYTGGNIPWVNTKEVNYNRIYSTEKNITELGIKNSAAKLIPANSVIVAMYCKGTAGRVAINKVPVATNQACCSLEINPDVADYEYIFYVIKHKYKELDNLANGAAQQNLNTDIIKNFALPIPSLKEQRAIAKLLSLLDQKIDVNTRTNDNLHYIYTRQLTSDK